MWRFLALVLLPLALAQDWVTPGCGVSKYDDAGTPQDNRVINGWTARPGEFPWQCELRYLGSFSCGAVIISAHWVITAAHCVAGRTPSSLTIVVGQHVRSDSDDGVIHSVEDFEYHADYDATGEIENDVAVVRLDNAIEFNEDTHPACRPEGNYATDSATTSGWGQTAGGTSSDTLQFANQPIMDQPACDEGCFPAGWILPGMICYGSCDGSHDQAICFGDSGGPTGVWDSDNIYEVVGLSSWVVGSCLSDQPNALTNVSYFNTWIDEHAVPLD